MLRLLEVIIVFDATISPPKSKLLACVNPSMGWFYRINSKPFLRPNVALAREPDHLFLEHDSFLHCEILEVDDYLIESFVRANGGPIGVVSAVVKREIARRTMDARYMSLKDKQEICRLLKVS